MRYCNWCGGVVAGGGVTCSAACAARYRERGKVVHYIASGAFTVTESGCWLWPHKGPEEYGPYKTFYKRLRGEIPHGLVPDHLCRNRPCVNPWHIELVTHKENTLRGTAPTAENARKTHCIRGHEFTPENILRTTQGYRTCRTCKNAYYRDLNKRNGSRRKTPVVYDTAKRKLRDLARRTTKECVICGSLFLGLHSKTCGRSCRGKLSRT